MNGVDRELLSTSQRQSPLAVVFLALRSVRQLGLSQLLIAGVFIFNARAAGGLVVVVPVLLFLLLAISVVSWWRFTFLVVDDELRVTRGVLSVDRLSLPLDRVQSVSIDQEFLHRMVGLVRASVNSAGAAETEFSIDAVERPIAEALQRLAAEHVAVGAAAATHGDQIGPPPPVAPDEIIVRRTPGELVKIAISQSPLGGLALLPPLFFVADDVGGALGIDLPDIDGQTFGTDLIGLGAIVVFAGVCISLVLQLAREFLTNWDLTLTSTPTGYRRSAGLLSKTSRASSTSRVQRFETNRNLFQALFGIRNVIMPTVGDGNMFVPGCVPGEVARLRERIIEGDAEVPSLDRRISPAAIFLTVRNAAVVVLLATAVLIALTDWRGLVVTLLLPWVLFVARRRNARTRWGFSDGGVALHAETFVVSTNEMALRKVQTAIVRQSFFQRRRELATIRLAAADGGVTIAMIPLDEAEALRDRALFVAETDRRAWM